MIGGARGTVRVDLCTESTEMKRSDDGSVTVEEFGKVCCIIAVYTVVLRQISFSRLGGKILELLPPELLGADIL